MAEMDTGLSNLWWIQKPHWLDTTDSSEKGTRMAQWGAEMTQRDEQQRRQYALQLSQLDLRKREGDVQMQGQVLDQQLKRLQLADVGELQKGYTALQAGQDYDPKLVTHTAALTWQNAKADNDLAAARSAAQAARNKRAAETILEVPESEEFIFPEPGKVNSEALARWSAIADQQKESRVERIKMAGGVTGPPEIVTVGNSRYVRNPKTGALHNVPPDYSEGANLVPLHDADGKTIGYGLPNTRGGITQVKSQGEGMKVGDRAKILQGQIKANNEELKGAPPVEREKELRDDNKRLSGEIRDLLKGGGSSTAPKVLKWNPATNDFE